MPLKRAVTAALRHCARRIELDEQEFQVRAGAMDCRHVCICHIPGGYRYNLPSDTNADPTTRRARATPSNAMDGFDRSTRPDPTK